jgi:prepilin-type processing-associated H-X9-DG protein
VEKSRATKSLSNLRTVGSHILAYESQNNQRLPVLIDWDNYVNDGAWWANTVVAELGLKLRSGDLPLPDEFYCPQAKRHHPWSDFGANDSFIAHKAVATDGLSALAINQPSKKVLLCSAKDPNIPYDGSWYFNGAAFAAQGYKEPASVIGPINRNAGFCNLLFADGHVEAVNMKTLSAQSIQDMFLP